MTLTLEEVIEKQKKREAKADLRRRKYRNIEKPVNLSPRLKGTLKYCFPSSVNWSNVVLINITIMTLSLPIKVKSGALLLKNGTTKVGGLMIIVRAERTGHSTNGAADGTAIRILL